MPHITNTPESLLSRSDSKNPATTCRGITSNGQPCRRPLASPSSSPSRSPGKFRGRQNADPTALYCWQHKDQAPTTLLGNANRKDSNFAPVHPRTSIDTLMDRLGVLDLNGSQDIPNKHRIRKPRRRRVCCCFEIIEDDELQPSRPANAAARPPAMQQVPTSSIPARPQKVDSKRPRNPAEAKTKAFLSWIPQTLSPQTTSILLTELAKPISESDEPGYIYMFWVTPSISSTSKPPPSDVARSLLPVAETPENIRRVSDAIRTAKDLNTLTSKPTPTSPGTVRLKIGRTSNVQRRLNEWTRQCSNHLTLIRYYPYSPSTPQHSPQRHGQGERPNSGAAIVPGCKVPHVHRVERLIHLELADIRARDLGPCEECGKEHREWFEVAAEKAALRRVDECIRRWVKWAESQ